jgi:aspartyl protease family protein
MSQNQGPWRGEEPPRGEPAHGRSRLFVWVAFIAAGAVGLWLLFQAFPGAIQSGQDTAWLVYGLVWASFLSLRLLSGGPIRWGEKAKHAAIWLGIIAVIAVGFTYRGEVAGVFNRVRSEGSSGYPVSTGAREMVVTADPSGGYFVMGKVNGKVVRFLVDTGASDTVLSPADAHRVGIDVAALPFDRASETANGVGYGAAVRVDELTIGSISMADMPVMVNQAPMRQSLLGMSFLSRLESFHFRDGRLYLTARE